MSTPIPFQNNITLEVNVCITRVEWVLIGLPAPWPWLVIRDGRTGPNMNPEGYCFPLHPFPWYFPSPSIPPREIEFKIDLYKHEFVFLISSSNLPFARNKWTDRLFTFSWLYHSILISISNIDFVGPHVLIKHAQHGNLFCPKEHLIQESLKLKLLRIIHTGTHLITISSVYI